MHCAADAHVVVVQAAPSSQRRAVGLARRRRDTRRRPRAVSRRRRSRRPRAADLERRRSQRVGRARVAHAVAGSPRRRTHRRRRGTRRSRRARTSAGHAPLAPSQVSATSHDAGGGTALVPRGLRSRRPGTRRCAVAGLGDVAGAGRGAADRGRCSRVRADTRRSSGAGLGDVAHAGGGAALDRRRLRIASAGQSLPTPAQLSATSHRPADGAALAVDACERSAGQSRRRPLHSRRRRTAPAAARHRPPRLDARRPGSSGPRRCTSPRRRRRRPRHGR